MLPILNKVCTPLVSSCYLVPALTHIPLNPACTLAISVVSPAVSQFLHINLRIGQTAPELTGIHIHPVYFLSSINVTVLCLLEFQAHWFVQQILLQGLQHAPVKRSVGECGVFPQRSPILTEVMCKHSSPNFILG